MWLEVNCTCWYLLRRRNYFVGGGHRDWRRRQCGTWQRVAAKSVVILRSANIVVYTLHARCRRTKLKFHGSSFLIPSPRLPREDVANMSRRNRACRTRMLHRETAPVEFQLYAARVSVRPAALSGCLRATDSEIASSPGRQSVSILLEMTTTACL